MARRLGKSRSTIKRWQDDSAFQELISENFEEATGSEQSLASLIPDAYSLLKRALLDGGIPAARARLALDILKEAERSGVELEESESSLAKKLAEIDTSGMQYEPD